MIRTIVWFGAGGLFTACYANLVRGLPMWRTPLMHVFWTSVGTYLGYKGHMFEETAEERYTEMIKKHKNAPWYPKGQLLAERYAREKAEKEGVKLNLCGDVYLQLCKLSFVRVINVLSCATFDGENPQVQPHSVCGSKPIPFSRTIKTTLYM